MSEEEYGTERSMSGLFMAVVVIALLAALGSLVWCYGLQNHLNVAQQKLVAADQRNADLAEKLDATNARLRATSETLGQSVGIAQKQIETRAKAILAAQVAATSRLEDEQAATKRQIGAV